MRKRLMILILGTLAILAVFYLPFAFVFQSFNTWEWGIIGRSLYSLFSVAFWVYVFQDYEIGQ